MMHEQQNLKQKPNVRIPGYRFPHWVNNAEYFAVVPGEDLYKKISIVNENKWKVFYFYDRDFEANSLEQVLDFDKLSAEMEELNTVLYGVSQDSESCKLAWRKQEDALKSIKHTLIADVGNLLAQECGIVDVDTGITSRVAYIVSPFADIVYAVFCSDNVNIDAQEVLTKLKQFKKIIKDN